jgi:hypothetical protein
VFSELTGFGREKRRTNETSFSNFRSPRIVNVFFEKRTSMSLS